MSNSDMNRRPSHRGSASVRRSRRRDASGGSANTGSSFQTKSSGGGSAARPSQKLSSGRDTSGSQSDGGNAKKYILIGIAALAVIALIIFGVSKLGGDKPEPETTESLAEGAFSYDAAIDLREVLDFGESSETQSSSEEDGESEEGEELPSGVISVYGKTADEIRSEIMALYDWDLKVVNEEAEVGATIMPTVDPDETTAPATMGDPENPDSDLSGDQAEESKADEPITVASEVEVPDLILQQLNAIIMDIEADAAEAEALEAQMSAEASSAEEEEALDEESETEAGPVIYVLSLEDSASEIERIAQLCGDMWYKAPKGASIGSYNAETDEFVMEGAESGFKVDTDAVRDAITQMVDSRQYTGTVDVIGEKLSADSATNLAAYKIIGTYQTKTTSNSVRNKNIQLACQALNGTIVFPGEELSFNDAVGQRTAEKGYGAAAAYNNGEVVQEIGGGVCQVSTTLYNAVLRSGLKTTRRQSHTFKPTYVTPGFDATISWGGPDYCFANVPADSRYSNSESYAIGIYAKYSNQTVTVSIYGRPVLKDGYTYELESTKIKDIPVVRKLIEPGSDQQPTSGSMGSQWQTYLVVKKDGEQIERTLDHNTYYSGHVEYYTDQTTTVPTLPTDTVPASESETETVQQIIEGPDGGPGVSGPGVTGPGVTSTTPAETEASIAPTDDHTYPSSSAPETGPGVGVPTAPASTEAAGPGIISDAPGIH